MFSHYLKIALRNIRKYALQNTVSVIGLAAGFVCLCLSSAWLYYELFASSSEQPIAFSTWEGSFESELQAEPVDM